SRRVWPVRSGWTSPRKPSRTSGPRLSATGVGSEGGRPARDSPGRWPGGAEASGPAPPPFRLRYETAKMARQARTAHAPALSDMAVTSFVAGGEASAAGDWPQVGALRVSIPLSTVEVTFATQRLQ